MAAAHGCIGTLPSGGSITIGARDGVICALVVSPSAAARAPKSVGPIEGPPGFGRQGSPCGTSAGCPIHPGSYIPETSGCPSGVRGGTYVLFVLAGADAVGLPWPIARSGARIDTATAIPSPTSRRPTRLSTSHLLDIPSTRSIPKAHLSASVRFQKKLTQS